MNIYIPDIKLPKDEPGAFQVIVMYVGADRKLRAECEGTHEVTIVPPHGRLIDADVLKDMYPIESPFGFILHSLISDAPTVIPAEPYNNLSKPCKAEEGE